MKQYLDALAHVMNHGTDKENRTNVKTRSVFGYHMRFDLTKGFPAVTTKKLHWKSVVSELLWMLEGSTDERRLAEIHYGKPREELIGKTTIWTANADNPENKNVWYNDNNDTYKDLGPIYGYQWRNWPGEQFYHVDQISELIRNLKENPESRRHIVSAWNADSIPEMALPPCHCLFQFDVTDGRLSCQLYQRSADLFLGVPFNIASYALLTHIIAEIVGLKIGEFIWTGGDVHIYHNHFDAVRTQFNRKPHMLPVLIIPPFKSLKKVLKSKPDDFILENYVHHDAISAEMVV